MANIQAICSECGAHLTLDHEGACCPFCGTTIAMGPSGGYELTIRSTLAEDGEAFMEMGDWTSAQNAFSRLIANYPYDYRGWWGMAQVYSRDFTCLTPTQNIYDAICEKANRAMKSANAEERLMIVSAMNNYKSRLANGGALRDTFLGTKTLEKQPVNQERRKLEKRVAELTKKIEMMRKEPRRSAIVAGLVAFAGAAVLVLIQIFGGHLTPREGILFALLLLFGVYVVAFVAYMVSRLITQNKLVALKKSRKRLVREMESIK